MMFSKHDRGNLPVGEPKKPHKNLSTRRAAIFGARAHPKLKQKNSPSVMRNTKLLPHTSDSGANSKGPVANPKRKVVMPSVATVLEHPNSLVTPPMAEAWMLEENVMVAVMRTMMMVADHFLTAGQFLEFSEASSRASGGLIAPCVW